MRSSEGAVGRHKRAGLSIWKWRWDAYLDHACGLAAALAHVDDPEVPAHGKRDDLVRVHPDVSDLLVWDALVKRPRRHILLCAGVPCDVR